MQLSKVKSLKGEIHVPGDKSITHRAVMLGSLANGTTEIRHFLNGADCLSTISCFQKMGVNITISGDKITICAGGLNALKCPGDVLDVGNSGTTLRLLSGILSANRFESELTGDSSIQKRPMKRIMEPLSLMGAEIKSIHDNGCAPIRIRGKLLTGIHYTSPVASAQVKSALLLAGLYAEGDTSITEPYLSRNHSEIMLRQFGADVRSFGTTATISPSSGLEGQNILVPGDISSAAYFIAAGLLVPDSEILLRNVGINPTRDGILRAAKLMGGDITIYPLRDQSGEPTADILVRSSRLHGITIGGELIPTLIDEIPVLAIMAAYAQGQTVIKDASELKVKESDRILAMTRNLSEMGCPAYATDDGMIIEGGNELTGCTIIPHHDHRIAMSFSVAALLANGTTTVLEDECIPISYPGFFNDLSSLIHG